MIALRQRNAPQAWPHRSTEPAGDPYRLASDRRSLLIHHFCGAVVFLALMVAYLLLA